MDREHRPRRDSSPRGERPHDREDRGRPPRRDSSPRGERPHDREDRGHPVRRDSSPRGERAMDREHRPRRDSSPRSERPVNREHRAPPAPKGARRKVRVEKPDENAKQAEKIAKLEQEVSALIDNAMKPRKR